VRARLLKKPFSPAVDGAIWTQTPQVSLRLRRLSLKCWFIGHDDWIRRTPDRLYLECFECGRETPGWLTKNHPVDRAGGPSRARRCSHIKAILRSRWSVR
jgi:hypothetical protein